MHLILLFLIIPYDLFEQSILFHRLPSTYYINHRCFMSVPCVVFILSQRSRLEHQIGTDPHQGQRALRPAVRDEGVHIRPHQQPRGQEPSRGQRDKPGSGPPPPPHRDRESRDQV